MSYKILLALFFVLISQLAYPQSKEKTDIYIYADKKKYYSEYLDLIGNPKIKNGQDTLTAVNIKYFSEFKKAISRGNVKIFDHLNTIEVFGKMGEYFTESKYAKLITDTKLISIKDQFVVYSEIMERFGDTKTYVARGNVLIYLEQEKATITADKCTYQIENKMVVLSGNPQILHEGTKYSADKIHFNTKSRTIILDGNSQVLKDNQQITAVKIKYLSSHIHKKAIFYGNPQLTEFSANDSILKGKPYRVTTAKKIIFYNVDKGKAVFIGNPKFSEFYIEDHTDTNKSVVNYLLHKRSGSADLIKYFGGTNKKYALIGHAKIYDSQKAAFAERIDFFEGSLEEVAVLIGKPILYEFFNKNETEYSTNKIKRKATANIVKYYNKSKKIILKGEASVFEGNGKIKADYIEYKSGDNPYGIANGNAKMKRDEESASADQIKFYGKNLKQLILSGNAYYTNGELDSEADFIEHDENIGKTILTGNVKISDDEKEATASKIVYIKDDKVETAILTGSPMLIKDDRKVFAQKIDYKKDDNKELIILTDKACYQRKEKAVYANEIVYHTVKNPGEENDDEKIILKDHVRIVDSKRIITGDKGEYYISNKKSDKSEHGKLIGNCEVIKKESEQNAHSDVIDYIKDNKQQETIILKGNAEVGDEKKAGYAEKITYHLNFENKDLDKIVLIGNPRIQDEKSIATGEKIELFDGSEKQVKIFNSCKYINEEDEIEITGDYLFYDEDREILRATKNPVYTQRKDELTIYSNQIESYRKKDISIATGDVKIVQKNKNIYGERAKFYEKKKNLIVTGNASVLEKNNLTKATKIILNTKTKKIKLIGVKKSQIETK